MTRRSRPRVPRPRAVLSAIAALALGLYMAGWVSLELVAAWFGFLAVMAHDSIAGSLDRLSQPPPVLEELRRVGLFDASDAPKRHPSVAEVEELQRRMRGRPN